GFKSRRQTHIPSGQVVFIGMGCTVGTRLMTIEWGLISTGTGVCLSFLILSACLIASVFRMWSRPWSSKKMSSVIHVTFAIARPPLLRQRSILDLRSSPITRCDESCPVERMRRARRGPALPQDLEPSGANGLGGPQAPHETPFVQRAH